MTPPFSWKKGSDTISLLPLVDETDIVASILLLSNNKRVAKGAQIIKCTNEKQLSTTETNVLRRAGGQVEGGDWTNGEMGELGKRRTAGRGVGWWLIEG